MLTFVLVGWYSAEKVIAALDSEKVGIHQRYDVFMKPSTIQTSQDSIMNPDVYVNVTAVIVGTFCAASLLITHLYELQ